MSPALVSIFTMGFAELAADTPMLIIAIRKSQTGLKPKTECCIMPLSPSVKASSLASKTRDNQRDYNADDDSENALQ